MSELLKYWPLIFPTIVGGIWLIRLEGKVKANAKQIEENENDIKQIGDIRVTVGKIETALGSLSEQVQMLVTHFIKNK